MYKFKGKHGEFLMGIPARDLSDDDVASLSDEQKDYLKAHLKTDDPLYEKAPEAKAETKEDVKAKEDVKDEKAKK